MWGVGLVILLKKNKKNCHDDSCYPAGKQWVLLKSAHQNTPGFFHNFDPNVPTLDKHPYSKRFWGHQKVIYVKLAKELSGSQ